MSGKRQVNVSDVIDKQPLSRFQMLVIGFCTLVAMLDGFDTYAISFVAPVLIQEWGVERALFGPIFSAALLGLMLGSITIGASADRFGRKKVIVVSTVMFGIFALLTAFAANTEQILVLRFLTGLGLGGAIPNLIALTTEYSPKRLRSLMVVLMFAGFPFGGVLGGLIAAKLILLFGWESVFIFGGVVPILLAVILLWKLPESIPFLVTQGKASSRARVADYLNHIAPAKHFEPSCDYQLPREEHKLPGIAVRHLFTENRAVGTLMLWLIFYTNLLMFYFINSWLPTLLTDAGHPIHLAIISAVVFSGGSVVGGFAIGFFVGKISPYKVVAINYICAAISSSLIGVSSGNLYVAAVVVFFAGFCIGGGQLVANALASNYYPASIRSTGVSWSVSWSRIGSMCGPLFAGWLIARELSIEALFYAIAVPAVIASIVVFYMGRTSVNTESEAGAATNSMV